MKGALVTLNPFNMRRMLAGRGNQAAQRPNEPAPVLTDAGGRFEFAALPAGFYMVNADKPGFLVEPADRPDRIQVGPSRDDAALRLTPLAKIYGKAATRDGDPVSGVTIRLLRTDIRDGRRVTSVARTTTTDDLGRYRMWNLVSGSYYAVAAGRSGANLFVGHAADAVNSQEGFAPVFFGGGSDRASAAAIPLAGGQELEANFEIAMQPAVRVRGTIRNAAPYQPVLVQLWRGGDTLSANRVAVNATTGEFEIQDVVPGSYLLRASQGAGDGRMLGERQVQVESADVEGLTVELWRGAEIAGTVQTVGTPSDQPRFCTVNLMPMDGEDAGGSVSAVVDPAGRLAVKPVLPGRYQVSIQAWPGYVQSAVSGTLDLVHGGVLTVGPGSVPQPIEIVVNNDGGKIAGTVDAPAGVPSVLIVPAGGGPPSAVMAMNGTFQSSTLAPGDYQVYLLKDLSTLEYRNPEVLRNLSHGQAVEVTAGATATVDLKEAQ